MHGLNFIHSTGSTIISIDNGKLVNNMKNANVERAAQFLEDLRKQGLTISGGNTEALGTGKLAFYAMGIWEFWGLDGNYPEYSFNVVPYPRDPSADKYYLSTYTFGYLVPSGSKNVEGAAEFINMIRNSKVDPEMRAITRQSELSTVIEGTNRAEIYDFCDTFTEIGNFDYVTDACTGFTDVTTTINDILYNVTFATGENMKTWTQLRTENEGLINAGLETYNSGLTE